MADLDKRLKTVTTDLSDTDTEVDTLVSNVKKLVAAVNNVEKCADQGCVPLSVCISYKGAHSLITCTALVLVGSGVSLTVTGVPHALML